MTDDLYPVLADLTRRGEPAAVATVIRAERSVPRHVGSKMIVRADGSVVGSVGGGGLEARTVETALEVIADGSCRRLSFDLTGDDGVCGGEVEVFVEPVSQRSPLVVVGMGHVGRALLDTARHLPVRFVAVDDRPEFLEGLDAVETVGAAPTDLAGHLRPTARTAVVLCTRSHDLDGDALASLFAAEQSAGARCAFIGLVGSRTKAAHIRRRFADDPALAARFDEVAVPVGLDIGAETPHEIAVSILAEVLAALSGRDLSSGAVRRMSARDGRS